MRKATIQQVVDALPDEVDVDALGERLYVLRELEMAERQLANRQGVSHKDAKKRLERWLG